MKQYTLRRLLINVTVFCVMVAFVAAFPDVMLSFASLLILYSPVAAIIAIACYYSDRRLPTFCVVCGGALLGWMLAPRMFATWASPPSFWQLFMVDFQTVGVGAAVGAIIAATINLMLLGRRQRPA